jgi:hypothetical protein
MGATVSSGGSAPENGSRTVLAWLVVTCRSPIPSREGSGDGLW